MKKHRTCLAVAAAIATTAAFAADYTQRTNLPTIYVETENGAPVNSKEEYVRANLHYVTAEGVTSYDALGIRGRGNSTWGLAKKPYRVKFDAKQRFLGPDRANAKSWTLIANYADKTLMRNAVAACIGKFAGQPFTAAAQFVDLYLNGKYLGNYQVSDQMEVRKKRVEITEQEEPATETSNITGGYFLEVDGFADSEPAFFKTARGVKVTIKSPDDKIIAESQKKYIADYYQLFEDALFSENFKDPETGYRQYVDASTLASWYISTELTGNVDGFWSTYMYKEVDDPKLYWGPLWDYDIAFNNCSRQGDVSGRLMRDVGYGQDLTGLWVSRMWEDPWFVELINTAWKECVDRGIEKHVNDYIDAVAAEIEESQKLNSALWPNDKKVYDELVLFSTYAEGVSYLKNYITNRVAFLTEAFSSSMPTPEFTPEENAYYKIYNTGCGSAVDVAENGTLCIFKGADGRLSQHWTIEPAGEGYYRIVNRGNGLAIVDNAEHDGQGYQRGSTLALAAVDPENHKQHWSISPVAMGGNYVIVNRMTGYGWNNAGGSSNDGNPILSWTSDHENANKTTRQWKLTVDERATTAVDEIVPAGYSVRYSASASAIRFVSDDDSALEGTYCIYGAAGNLVRTGAIEPLVGVDGLAGGVYVLTWTVDGRTRSAKFVR